MVDTTGKVLGEQKFKIAPVENGKQGRIARQSHGHKFVTLLMFSDVWFFSRSLLSRKGFLRKILTSLEAAFSLEIE